MGVDYSAYYGLGVKIKHKELNKNELIEFLEYKLQSDMFVYFEVGEECYTGEENDVYLVYKDDDVIKEQDFTVLSMQMDNFIRKNDLIRLTDFGIIGGLHIH